MSLTKGFRNSVNLRDLGGIPTSDGRHIKPGLIFRSGGLYNLNDAELKRLRGFGLSSVIDLRTTRECDENPDPELPGARRLHYSGLEFRGGEQIDFSPAGMHRLGDGAREQLRMIRAYYLEMPFDNEAFRVVMDEFASCKTPFLFHCASGKDRTGVAAMIVELALGADYNTVLDDYLLSRDYLSESIAAAKAEHAELMAADANVAELIVFEVGVHEHLGRAVLDEMLARKGSFERYLADEYALDAARLAELRGFYLEADGT